MKKEKIGIVLIFISAILTLFIFVMTERLPQDISYHNFSDTARYFLIPNTLNVLSNLPLLIVGIWGLRLFIWGKVSRLNIVKSNILAYQILCFAVILVSIGSSYYHLEPDNATLVWDRLPMTFAFMAIFSVVISEFISKRLGKLLLLPLLFVGAISVFYWYYTEINEVGDLRFYAVVQFFPILAIAIILAFFKSQYISASKYSLLLAIYALAKLCEHFDSEIHQLLVIISGHSIKHILAAMGIYFVISAYKNTKNKPLK